MSARNRVPFVTLFLIVANLAAAIGTFLNPNLLDNYGFSPSQGMPQGAITAFTGLFLHGSTLHLLGNLIFLAAVGAAVELATGSWRFLAVFLVSGLCGVVAYGVGARNATEAVPLVGASGCISGCVAYYAARYTHLRVPIAPSRALSVAMVTGVWLVLQIVGAFVRVGETVPGIAFLAHLGGFVGGLVLTFLFKAPDLREKSLGHEVLDAMNDRGPGALIAAASDHLVRHPDDVATLAKLADAYRDLGDIDGERKVLLRLLPLESPQKSVECLERLSEPELIRPIPVVRRIQFAETIADESASVAKKLLESCIAVKSDPHRPDALAALVELVSAEDPGAGGAYGSLLKKEYPLHDVTKRLEAKGLL